MRLAASSSIAAAMLLMVVCVAKGSPMIENFSPPYGPLVGKTKVQINISDAQDYQVMSVRFAIINANIYNFTHYGSLLVVICETGQSPSDVSEKISVKLLAQNGSSVDLRSKELYSYKPNPEIYRMENNAVIKSGGVRLWVTGMNLLSVMSPVLVIRKFFEGRIVRFEAPCKQYNNTKMSCISPNLRTDEPTTTSSTTVMLTIIQTTPPKPNMKSTSLKITPTIQPGNSNVPYGSTFINPSQPISQPTSTDTILNTPSSPATGLVSPITSGIYPSTTPYIAQLTTTQIFQRRRRRQVDDQKPDYFAGFEMDGIEYSNVSRIYVYDDPVFSRFDEKDNTKSFFPDEETEIVIEGEQLASALREEDIKVFIGTEDCPVTSLSANQLTCAPPSEEPALPPSKNKHPVEVHAGTTLKFFIGYLRYGELERKISKLLMLILIGVGVLIFWLFVFSIICYVIRRKKRKRIKSKQPESAGSHNSTGQSYLTDYGSDTDSMPFMGSMYNMDPLDILPADLRHKVIQSRIDSNRLQVGQCIGTGSYGRVFRGTLLLEDEDTLTVAVKTLKRVSVYYEREMTDFLHEALIMKDLRHPNIIHLYGVVIFNYAPFVVFEYMDLGDLRSYIKKEKTLPLKRLLNFALQIAHALTYLTSQSFVHMDVAARNCLINSNMRVKLGDFGLSRDLHGMDYYKLADKAKPMPVKWMALESLQWGRFTSHSDVWSFGVLLWELLTRGQRPYQDVDNMDIKAYIASGHRLPMPRLADNNLYNIMTLTWREDPSSRPTFEELVIKIQEAIDRLPS